MSSIILRKPVARDHSIQYASVEQELGLGNEDNGGQRIAPAVNRAQTPANNPDREFIELVEHAFNYDESTVPTASFRHSGESFRVPSTLRTVGVSPVSHENPYQDGEGRIHSARSSIVDPPKPSRPLVKWGVPLYKKVQMVGYVLLGAILAIGHHLFFHSLNAKVVGSTSRQQWAIAFGTAFAFLVVCFLSLAVSAAYMQYVWRFLRKASISIKGIDKIFALTSDLSGFFSLELLKKAKLVLLFALVSW